METNPYEPPKQADHPRSSWRSFWRRFCLANLCAAGSLVVPVAVIASSAQDSTDNYWLTILNGLLALAELVSWAMAGIGAVGWIITRRAPSVDSLGIRSGYDA